MPLLLYLIMSECAPCGLKIALCELTCVVKLFIVAEEEVVEAGGGVAEGGGVECWHENPTKNECNVCTTYIE